MASRTLLIAAPLALGAAVLAWPLMKSKEGRAASPAKAVKAIVAPKPAAGSTVVAPSTESRAAAAVAPVKDPATSAIQSRVNELEARLRELEARRDALTVENGDLDRQIREKYAEAGAKAMAQWRVQSWEKLLGLSETQKQDLLDLCTRWAREDAGRQAGRDVWAAREGELRSRLTAEQAAKLNEYTSAQAQRQWSMMGRTLGGMIGASKEEQARLQQAAGSIALPSGVLLAEAHGADWSGLYKEAAGRIRPLLTGEQAAKLDSYQGGNGSWSQR